MTFGVDLIPNNNTQQRKLGNSENKWDIYADDLNVTSINNKIPVSGVKGNEESAYRTGDINITPDNVGAKAVQTAISDPIADGTSLEFIDSISQDIQGVITPTKKEIPIATNLTETTPGKVLDATQGKILNDTKLDKDFDFTAATLPYSNLEKIALRGTDGNNYYTTIGELASQIGGGGGTSQTALVHYIKNCGTISGSGTTLNWTNPQIDNNITENMVVLKAELSNPAAQTSDWTCTTTNGYVTISGTMASGSSTNVLLYFGVSLSTAPSIIVNLASNSSDNVLKTNPTPGVMGVLGITNGGMGANSVSGAWANLGIDKYLNSMSRHTRLLDFSLTDLQAAVADQNLAKYGLKVGDQKVINRHTYVIAGLNGMKGSHNYTCTDNHAELIVIPHTVCEWNASGNTYTGANNRGAGYKNCDLQYYLANTVMGFVNTDLGASHVYSHKKLFGNAINQSGYNRYGTNSGCTSGWEWVDDVYISALTEAQVYGGDHWSSSGFDTGEADTLLPVFAEYKHTEIFGNEQPWLRNVATNTAACFIEPYGSASFVIPSVARHVAGLILYH